MPTLSIGPYGTNVRQRPGSIGSAETTVQTGHHWLPVPIDPVAWNSFPRRMETGAIQPGAISEGIGGHCGDLLLVSSGTGAPPGGRGPILDQT